MIAKHSANSLLRIILFITFIFFIASCEKDDLTVDITGVYNGKAIVNNNITGYRDVIYDKAQIQITRVDDNTINLILKLDSSNIYITSTRNFTLNGKNYFEDWASGGLGPSTENFTGTLSGATFKYKYKNTSASTNNTIDFEGVK